MPRRFAPRNDGRGFAPRNDVRKLCTTPQVDNVRRILEVCHLTIKGADIRRVHTLEEWEHFMAYAVAPILRRSIGLVFAIRNLPSECMAFYLFAGESQKGTEDCHVASLLAMT